MTRWSLPAACLLTLAACASAPPESTAPATAVAPAAAAAPAAVVRPSGLLLQNFDRSVRPQDDLYRFVNGTWMEKTDIPADKPLYGSFVVLQDGAEKNLKAIAEEDAAANAAAGTDRQLIGDYYSSFMDESQAEKLGVTPLEPELARIRAIKDRTQLLDYLSRAQVVGVDNFIDTDVIPDAKNPEVNTLWLTQSGFGLPERDYYFSKEKRFTEIRAAYLSHIEKAFRLAGRKDAAAAAKRVMAFETRMAQASWPAVKMRDIEKLYNPLGVAAAQKATPGIDWSRWLAGLGITDAKQVVLAQPDYFAAVGKALQHESLATWQDYLSLRAIDGFSPYLSSALVNEQFDFYGRTLAGTPQLKPRWKRALGELEGSIGDLLGKEYVARHFPPEAKRRMDELVQNLLKAFDAGIGDLDWMGPETRKAAEDKIRHFTVKIGYPTKWKEYPGLSVSRDNLVANVMRAREANARRELAKVDHAVDKTEWGLTP
ncbi:MAG TPA: hypothetical protein VF277_09520, partial [Steroidobacteraceae bacterium]